MHKPSVNSTVVKNSKTSATCKVESSLPPLSLPPLVNTKNTLNCTKPCCFKFRLMSGLPYRPRSSSTKAAMTYNRKNSYKSTYSQEYGIKPFSPTHKIFPRKIFNHQISLDSLPPLTSKETLKGQISEKGLLKHYQYQSNYAHTYLGMDPLDLSPENTAMEGSNNNKKRNKKQQRLMSVFQQDYQVPCVSERLKTIKKPRPADHNYLPLIPQKNPPKLKTSYVSDYCHQKLPQIDDHKTDNRKVQFRATDSWIDCD